MRFSVSNLDGEQRFVPFNDGTIVADAIEHEGVIEEPSQAMSV
jgi:hypothetical protein